MILKDHSKSCTVHYASSVTTPPAPVSVTHMQVMHLVVTLVQCDFRIFGYIIAFRDVYEWPLIILGGILQSTILNILCYLTWLCTELNRLHYTC